MRLDTLSLLLVIVAIVCSSSSSKWTPSISMWSGCFSTTPRPRRPARTMRANSRLHSSPPGWRHLSSPPGWLKGSSSNRSSLAPTRSHQRKSPTPCWSPSHTLVRRPFIACRPSHFSGAHQPPSEAPSPPPPFFRSGRPVSISTSILCSRLGHTVRHQSSTTFELSPLGLRR